VRSHSMEVFFPVTLNLLWTAQMLRTFRASQYKIDLKKSLCYSGSFGTPIQCQLVLLQRNMECVCVHHGIEHA
jgi:hypothetical protein